MNANANPRELLGVASAFLYVNVQLMLVAATTLITVDANAFLTLDAASAFVNAI